LSHPPAASFLRPGRKGQSSRPVFHAQHQGLFSDAAIPLLFAAAMAVDGISGLLVGQAL
jgi:hypothetical protein